MAECWLLSVPTRSELAGSHIADVAPFGLSDRSGEATALRVSSNVIAESAVFSPSLSEIVHLQRILSRHRLRRCDDAMIRRPRTDMTISELKRAMDRRFDRVERTKVDKA